MQFAASFFFFLPIPKINIFSERTEHQVEPNVENFSWTVFNITGNWKLENTKGRKLNTVSTHYFYKIDDKYYECQEYPNHHIDFLMFFPDSGIAVQWHFITTNGTIITEVQHQLMEIKLNLSSVIKKWHPPRIEYKPVF